MDMGGKGTTPKSRRFFLAASADLLPARCNVLLFKEKRALWERFQEASLAIEELEAQFPWNKSPSFIQEIFTWHVSQKQKIMSHCFSPFCHAEEVAPLPRETISPDKPPFLGSLPVEWADLRPSKRKKYIVRRKNQRWALMSAVGIVFCL